MNRDERRDLALEHLSCLPQHERLEIALRIFSQAPAYGHGEVDNTPFREHYLIQHIREGLTADEVARRMEWFYGSSDKGDGTRVMRRLGLVATSNGGKNSFNVSRSVSYEVAVKLCDGLGLDYVDCDV